MIIRLTCWRPGQVPAGPPLDQTLLKFVVGSPYVMWKGKLKFYPRTGYEDPVDEVRRSSTTISLTSALDWGQVFNATPRLL